MSTQRRVYRLQCMSCTNRAEGSRAHRDGFPSLAGSMQELAGSALFARSVDAQAGGGTASPVRSATHLANMATNSLQKDHRSIRLVRQGQLPQGSTAHRHSLSPISILSRSVRVHPTLPQDPAGNRRRAERHDGKRNLYLKHPA